MTTTRTTRKTAATAEAKAAALRAHALSQRATKAHLTRATQELAQTKGRADRAPILARIAALTSRIDA
jgi:hypothetical protein